MKYVKNPKYFIIGLVTMSVVVSYVLFSGKESQNLNVTDSVVTNVEEIVLVPINSRQAEIVETLKVNLQQTFPGVKITVDQTVVTIPKDLFNVKRQQYNAVDMIKEIDKLLLDRRSTQIIIALTEENIYSENLNFVFSSSDTSNNVAVVSSYYLQKDVPVSPEIENRLEYALQVTDQRIYKTTLRMIGGMVGLEPRSSGRSECVMNFSNTLSELDKKGLKWCGDEKSVLKTVGLLKS